MLPRDCPHPQKRTICSSTQPRRANRPSCSPCGKGYLCFTNRPFAELLGPVPEVLDPALHRPPSTSVSAGARLARKRTSKAISRSYYPGPVVIIVWIKQTRESAERRRLVDRLPIMNERSQRRTCVTRSELLSLDSKHPSHPPPCAPLPPNDIRLGGFPWRSGAFSSGIRKEGLKALAMQESD